MLKIVSTLCAAAMAVSVPMAAPAVAMPVGSPVVDQTSNVTQIQYRDHRHNDRFERRGRDVYWRGHRGSREYRPGYRRHGDFWFPAAAFIAGAIVSGAIANQQPRYVAPPTRVYRGNNAHVEWCLNRYRSYRPSDNTFQPYNGPRRQCTSPYG